MRARPHTTAVRITPGQARLLLEALAVIRLTVQVPDQVDALAEVIRPAANNN